MTWSSVGPLDDLWEGDMRAHTVEGHDIVVLRVDGGDVHAYQGICPHQEQRLADGDFVGVPGNCEEVGEWVNRWVPLADAAIDAYLAELPGASGAASESKAALARWRHDLGLP